MSVGILQNQLFQLLIHGLTGIRACGSLYDIGRVSDGLFHKRYFFIFHDYFPPAVSVRAFTASRRISFASRNSKDR